MKRSTYSPFPLFIVGIVFLIAGLALALGISAIAGKDIARIKRLEPANVAALA